MWADQQYQGGKGSQDRAGMTIEVIFALVMATLGHLWWLSSKEYTCSASFSHELLQHLGCTFDLCIPSAEQRAPGRVARACRVNK